MSAKVMILEFLEKLEGDDFINGQRDFAVNKLRLQREYYWMNKLRIIYPYSLKLLTGKHFSSLARFGNRREGLKKDVSMNQPNFTQLRTY